MARRRTKSSGEGWIDLFALMPWWVCVGLAITAYVALHAWAERPAPKLQPGALASQLDTVMIGATLKGFAAVGQYVLPIALLASAVVSAVRRKQRKELLAQAAEGQDLSAVDGMSWLEFELLIGESFRQKGYVVIETGGGGADGGVDLVLRRPASNGSETYLVQCKHWRAYKVGVDVVRELYGVMAARGAAGGFVVTAGRFTKEAMAFASGRNVRLIDGAKLKRMLAEVPAASSAKPERQPETADASALTTMVVCPSCSQPMVKRLAKRGPKAGQAFYGCSAYPVCKSTRPM